MFIRPLLECRRADLRRFLAGREEGFCEDSSNLDETIPRNRVRHQLLPAIERVAPGGIAALARFAALSSDDENFLAKRAIEAARSVVSLNRDGASLDARKLTELPGALARRVVRWAVHEVSPMAALRAAHVEAVRRLAAADKPYGHLDLPRVTVERNGALMRLSAPAGDRRQPLMSATERRLAIPGSVELPEAGLVLSAATGEPGGVAWPSGRDGAALQESSLALPLSVRQRRPGDRFRPLGAPGRRKLQDVFVDRKIPRLERDHVPIVVDARGRIVWVTGVGIAEECRVTAPSAGVVVLQVRPL
jgi:tRNA(Ile)-lysidine synthase